MALEDDFKNALSAWASGVSVVTTRAEGLVYGLTVSSFASVSLEPPLVLVCLGHGNRLNAMIAESRRFAVSLLSRDQEAASDHFASRGREPIRLPTSFSRPSDGRPSAVLDGVPMIATQGGLPVVEGALAWLACEVHAMTDAGDHAIVVGRVTEAAAADEGNPLVYWSRAYRGVERGGVDPE